MPREGAACQRQCVDIDGFSLHAAVRVDAHDRKRLEQPCRYITRPATSDERVQFDAAGQLELERKTPWRDGSTHEVMCPMELMQRLGTGSVLARYWLGVDSMSAPHWLRCDLDGAVRCSYASRTR